MESQLQLPFNQAQLEILKLFSQGLSNEETEELRKILVEFRFALLNKKVQEVAKRKNLNLEDIDGASQMHHRTKYRRKGQRPGTS